MRKFVALLSAGMAMAVMSGCGLNPIGTPIITIDSIDVIRMPSSAGSVYTTVSGKVEADTAISSITYQILNSNDLPASGITVTGPAVPSGEKKVNFDNYPITITVTYPAASAGTYKLKISVTAGLSVDASSNFVVIANGGVVSVKTNIAMGAQNASAPGLLDADIMKTYRNSLADETNRGKVDVIFSYSSALFPNALAFTSPDSASTGWLNNATARYKKVSATWSTITTQGGIDNLWNAGGVAFSRMAVSAGDIILILTSEGSRKAVQIVSVNGTGPTAIITINGKY
jgi:hypothetical protein